MRRIDPGLAADRGVDLRQQRSRHLHKIDAAAQDRSRKAGEIADHATAECHHQVVALDLRRYQGFADLFEAGIGFRAFALVNNDSRGGDAGLRQRGLGLLEPIPGDIAVGDDGGARAGPQLSDTGAQRWQHIAADDDVVGAVAERDIDRDRVGMFQRRGHRVTPSAPGVACAAEAVPPVHSQVCRASMHSSTIFSCGTSRDQIVRSACR